MSGPYGQIPHEDASMQFEDAERHRAAYGYCADPCDHPECHEATRDHNDNRSDDDTHEDEEDGQ